MLDYLVVAAVVVGLGLLGEAICDLFEQWGQQHLPEDARVELSKTDQEYVTQTQTLISRCFGDNPVELLKNVSNKERIRLVAEFADQLVELYDLDIEVDVMVNEVSNCGAYIWEKKKAVFNIILMMVDGDDEHFDICVRETLDTIIHELRHAVQHRTISEPNFWDVDGERRLIWAQNMAPGNYIRPSHDLQAYARQPIERDAVTFTAAVMEGVGCK